MIHIGISQIGETFLKSKLVHSIMSGLVNLIFHLDTVGVTLSNAIRRLLFGGLLAEAVEPNLDMP